MSSIKIKDLPEKMNELEDEDLFVVEDIEDTKKITLLRLKSAFSMDGILTSMKNILLDKINSFIQTHSSKYKELEEYSKQLEVTCNNLENDHIHDANRISELENKVIELNTLVDYLDMERNELNTNLTSLQKEKDSLLQKSISLENQLASNSNLISKLQSQIIDLQNQSKELNNVNNELQDLINQMEEESTSVIDTNFSEVNAKLASDIEDLMAYIRFYHPDVDTLEV